MLLWLDVPKVQCLQGPVLPVPDVYCQNSPGGTPRELLTPGGSNNENNNPCIHYQSRCFLKSLESHFYCVFCKTTGEKCIFQYSQYYRTPLGDNVLDFSCIAKEWLLQIESKL